MNFFAFVFIGLGVLFMLIMSIRICFLVLPRRAFPVPEIINNLESLSLERRVSFMMGLVIKGYLRKHILHNNAPEYDDSRYLQSYCNFLNNNRNINALKAIKGRQV